MCWALRGPREAMGDGHSTMCRAPAACSKAEFARHSGAAAALALPVDDARYQVSGSQEAKLNSGTLAPVLAVEASGSRRNSNTTCSGQVRQLLEGIYEEKPGRRSVWMEEQSNAQGPVEAARNVMQYMLEEDNLLPGQKADMEYVSRVLEGCMQCGIHRKHADDQDSEHNLREDQGVDSVTLDYLKTFGTKGAKKHKTFREVAQAVHFMVLMNRVRATPTEPREQLLGFAADAVKQELVKLDMWDEWDIFKFASLSSPHTLQYVGLTALERHKLLPQFNISAPKLRTFLAEIETQYQDNLYHNALHAADVVQTTHMLIVSTPSSTFSELEVLAALFAAICHDVGHGGVTNQFRVASFDEGALTYNDKSVNENMHCCLTYRTLMHDECNFLDGLTQAQAAAVRKMMVDIVLSTDMATHFDKIKMVKEMFEEKGSQIHKWESTLPFLELLVHGADISNPLKPMTIACEWSDRVLQEFFLQGDRERELGRQVSPLCDRNTVSKAASQCGFVDFIVAPTVEMLGKLCDVSTGRKYMQRYKAYFAEILEREKAAAEAEGKSQRPSQPATRPSVPKPKAGAARRS